MILQALCEYYDRKEQELSPFGFEEKAIPFVIVIDENGRFTNLENTAEIENGKTISKVFRVPKAAGRSGAKSYETANCLWDHFGYVAGHPKNAKPKDTEKQKDKYFDDAQKQHNSFKNRVEQISVELPDDAGVKAVNKFLKSENEIDRLKASDNWGECVKKDGTNLSFRLIETENLVCQSSYVVDWIKSQPLPEADVKEGFCLITGEKSQIARLHDQVSGVAQKPAPLAAINNSAYNSFGKEKGFNFPVSAYSTFKYVTALNHLLRKTSTTKFRIADTSYVCWADQNNSLENILPFVFSDVGDDPDEGAEAIKSLFSTIHNGAYQQRDGSDRFYLLALSPNSARIVVRLWQVGTVASFAANIYQWFEDLKIEGYEHYGYPQLKKLLRSSALQYKDDNIPPNMPADVVKSILSGGNLSNTFMQAVIRRIKSEQGGITYNRASILKACLNRKYRFSTTNQKEITVSLNKEEKRIGYCLGRLFAVLEKLQQDAQLGINATIRDRYYSSASCTPKSVFGTLLRLSTHHIKKLDNPAWRVNAEKRIGEVMELIDEFPSNLNLDNQGLFAIGYYHQKQSFYQKSEQGE